MTFKTPSGFITVAEAYELRDGTEYSVIGIVTDFLPPAPSRGSDLTMKINLWDMSCTDLPAISQDGITTRFFYPSEKKMPAVHDVGDVLILRRVKTRSVGSTNLCMSNYSTKWAVIPRSSILDFDGKEFEVDQCRTSDSSRINDLSIWKYAKEIVDFKDPRMLREPVKVTSLSSSHTTVTASKLNPRQKFHLIEQIQLSSSSSSRAFVDILVELRKIWDYNNVVEVRVTDYTENELLYNYTVDEARDGDEFGHITQARHWTGPWGRRTMQVSLWDEHASFVREAGQKGDLVIGSYLFLQNVHIRMNKMDAALEGHCRGGSSSSQTKVQIHKPHEAATNQRLKDLLVRKRDYERESRGIYENIQSSSNPSKTMGKTEDSNASQTVEPGKVDPIQPKQKRNRKKKEKNKSKRGIDEKDADAGQGESGQDRFGTNHNMRCETIDIPLTSIASIIDTESLKRSTPQGNSFRLPFQNCKYKCNIAIVDFFPDNLEDFSVPRVLSDYEVLSDYNDESDSDVSLSHVRRHPNQVRWEWHFFLWVRDVGSKSLSTTEQSYLLLQVAEKDAEYLLDTEACDLRSNPQELAKLKEKLFVIWGDLQEMKEETGKSGLELANAGTMVSSRPFKCFIKEYGVKARDGVGKTVTESYERMFRMTGTRIC